MKKNYTYYVALVFFAYIATLCSALSKNFRGYLSLNKSIKTIFLFVVVNLLFAQIALAQNSTGDFQSAGSGNWTSVTSWQTWNGSAWVAATTYPGQVAPPPSPAVKIQSGHTITVATNLTTQALGTVTVNGNLTLSPSPSPNTINLDTAILNIDGAGAVLNFTGSKARLNLVPTNAVLTLLNSGTISASPCNNNNEIYINSRLYAACAGGGSGVYTFGEVVTGGGTVNAFIDQADPITICYGNYDFSGGFTGLETNVTFAWKYRNVSTGGSLTTIATGTLADQSVPTSTTFVPAAGGQYIISLEITTAASFTNVETRTINVQSVPTAGTIATSQSICSGTAPSVLTSSVAGTGDGTITYEWQTNASGSYVTIGGQTGATYQPPTLTATTSYKRRTVSTYNGVACYSTYSNIITVAIESTPPSITCANPSASYNVNSGQCFYTVPNNALNPTASSDNCSGFSVSNNFNGTNSLNGAQFPVGTTTVIWTVTDSAGLTSTCQYNIVVVDNQDPVVTCPGNITVNAAAGLCNANVTVPLATASDNCSIS
ncbi:HYR domain-containing protein, partial [Flavobacteriaceae bacterium LMO-SS05]